MDSVVPFIGIDFGTSKSSTAWYDHRIGRADVILNAEGKQITPSVVYLGPTESETLVGDPAERKLGQEKVDQRRFVFSVKRDLIRAPTKILDGKVYSPVKVTSLILAKLREDADKRHFKQPVDRAVIAHPASFNTLQQDKIKEAANLAGFSQVALLPEPVAAALTYAYTGLKVGQYIMVYDFGGGTFDVAVLQRIPDGTFRRALASRGLPKCGGDDLDRAVYKYCEEIVQREKKRQISLTDEYDLRFLRLCRECKENLTSQRDYTFSNYLPSNNGRVLFEHMLDRSTFESRVRDYISQTVTLTQEVMQEANGKGCQVDTVVLIGGSSRVPLVWHSLVESLSVKPDEWQYQDIAVALGAAYHAQQLWGTAVKDAWANNILSKTNEVTTKETRSMSDQTPNSRYSQNPYQGDPQWPSQPQEGYPPAGAPNPSFIPPTQYVQPHAGSSSPYPSQPHQPGYWAPGPYPPYPGAGVPLNQSQQGNGMAVAGLVLGIISMFTWWYLFTLPIPIVGIILSALGRRSATRRTMATWGLVLSIISIALTIGLFVIGFIIGLSQTPR